MLSVISSSPPLRIRRILSYHLRGGAGSLFGGRERVRLPEQDLRHHALIFVA